MANEIFPPLLEGKLKVGESISETKIVNVPFLPPKADVVFCFDLTGSMGDILSTAKEKAMDIITSLNSLGIDINYGVTSHMDYPHSYDSYGYASTYGIGTDYAYALNQFITGDSTLITAAINGLNLGNGSDGPECYTRVFYESYADTNLGWRVGAKKILVHFGDNVPHDNDLNQDVPGTSGVLSTGGDPGRDEEMFTDDDLDLQTVLNEMKTNNIILIECRTTDFAMNYWESWTDITGGSAFITSSDDLVDNVTQAISDALTATTISGLHLETSSGYEAWLTSVVPSSYSGPTGVPVTFNITITVPDGTPDGIYSFKIIAKDDKDINYGEQTVNIEVYSIKLPDISGCYPSPQYIWPPNNKFVDIQILGAVDPRGGTVIITIESITSDEPTASIDGAAGTRHSPDADPNCIGTSIAIVRAERSGTGNGRVYQINFKATNVDGDILGSVQVYVPHDVNDVLVIDDGQNYDATQIN